MHKRHIKKCATTVAFLSFALSAVAAVRTLPTPPESTKSDTESSICQLCGDWPGLGRRVELTLSASFTPSNCVQVAFGRDLNSDGDLAPEETQLVLGVDCGMPFARWEEGVENRCRCRVDVETCSAGQHIQEDDVLSTPTLYTFAFKQPSSVSDRVDFVKVTKRGRGESDAEIVAEIIRRGAALFIR